ncbi:MAG: diadenylate cyclase CdaA [Defluviitaleaceae bacterium]|nr:diadenylate cyclase CdaA [Defluviitaleaceae bacterium]
MNPFSFIYESLSMFHMPFIGFSEMLDIIILCGIIYYILRWIRQTHAWALLKGIAIVVLVALIAYVFELVTVIWLVQNTLAMGLIALVILFQPELRKALEQLGRGVQLSGSDYKGDTSGNIIDEIAGAVANMAAHKTGALICLEREVTLSDIAKTGIKIDACITRQLIVNVFEKNTPLHDGAMVIRYERIVSAACILPLTAANVDHELGTRHRAALGISEISDALIVVVSEETGAVSAARNGKLSRHLSDSDLRNMLSTEIYRETKRRLRLWKNRK